MFDEKKKFEETQVNVQSKYGWELIAAAAANEKEKKKNIWMKMAKI